MKNIIFFLISWHISLGLFSQSQCIYADSTGLYYKDGKICDLTEQYKDIRTNTIVIKKYEKGKLVSFTEYDTIMNKMQEFYSKGKVLTTSNWDKHGMLRNHSIEHDTIIYDFSWDENGNLTDYEEMKDSNCFKIGYFSNGLVSYRFTCDYKENQDCILKTYGGDGEVWFLTIWRPLKFYQIDVESQKRLPLEDYRRGLLAISMKEFGTKGRLEEEIFFKNGVANKIITYKSDGSSVIRYCDKTGTPIEKK